MTSLTNWYDSIVTPGLDDFTHDIDDHNDCTWIRPCLTIHLGGVSKHEIDVGALDFERFQTFLKKALAGETDAITLPGAECGTWQCKNGQLYVEIFDYGKVFGDMMFDLNANDRRWGRRLKSVVESIRVWRNMGDDATNYWIWMDYDEDGHGEYVDDVDRTIEKRFKELTPKEREAFNARVEKYKKEHPIEPIAPNAFPSGSSGGSFFDLVAIGPQDRMLM